MKDGTFVAGFKRAGTLYRLKTSTATALATTTTMAKDDLALWHKRLGHLLMRVYPKNLII
jgi:hypothetical protein